MKNLAALLLLLWAACCPAANLLPARVEKISIGGKEYVRLEQWARGNSFAWRWLSKNEAEVSSRYARMQFITDSRRMSFNGITVNLSEPVASQNGALLVAALDLTTAIQPLIFLPKGRPRAAIKNICIDAGHGGKDIGEHVGSENEKKYTLLLAQELGAQLRKAGYTVSLTRTTDTFIDLDERPAIAQRRGADLFICLHFNSVSDREVRGVETYCMTPQNARSFNDRGEGAHPSAYVGNLNNARNMVLAYEIQKSLVRSGPAEDRGVKRARYAVLRGASMPAVLVEGGFMSNPAEARNIYSPAWRKQMAQAIASGIASYRRIVEP